jgi:hypothetical protein
VLYQLSYSPKGAHPSKGGGARSSRVKAAPCAGERAAMRGWRGGVRRAGRGYVSVSGTEPAAGAAGPIDALIAAR